MRLLCILRGTYRTFISTSAGYRGHWISGCSYKTDDEQTPENVHVIRCASCRHYVISWSWGRLESVK